MWRTSKSRTIKYIKKTKYATSVTGTYEHKTNGTNSQAGEDAGALTSARIISSFFVSGSASVTTSLKKEINRPGAVVCTPHVERLSAFPVKGKQARKKSIIRRLKSHGGVVKLLTERENLHTVGKSDIF